MILNNKMCLANCKFELQGTLDPILYIEVLFVGYNRHSLGYSRSWRVLASGSSRNSWFASRQINHRPSTMSWRANVSIGRRDSPFSRNGFLYSFISSSVNFLMIATGKSCSIKKLLSRIISSPVKPRNDFTPVLATGNRIEIPYSNIEYLQFMPQKATSLFKVSNLSLCILHTNKYSTISFDSECFSNRILSYLFLLNVFAGQVTQWVQRQSHIDG